MGFEPTPASAEDPSRAMNLHIHRFITWASRTAVPVGFAPTFPSSAVLPINRRIKCPLSYTSLIIVYVILANTHISHNSVCKLREVWFTKIKGKEKPYIGQCYSKLNIAKGISLSTFL